MKTGKIFGIGMPRTGTRSLSMALEILGYRTGHWLKTKTWLQGDFETDILAELDAATDTPIPVYYPEFDKRYPGSKFICTHRDTESWLRSIKKHQEGLLGDSHRDERRRRYRLLTYGMYQFSLERYRYVVETHQRNVLWYFQDRPSDLLMFDLCGGDGWEKLCSFLGKPIPDQPFPRVS